MRFYAIATSSIILTVDSAAEAWDLGGDGTGTFTEGAPLSNDGGQSITHRGCNCLWNTDLIDIDFLLSTFASTPPMTIYRCQDRLGNGVVEKANVLGADAIEWNQIGNGDFVDIALQDAGLERYNTDSINGVPEWEPGVDYELDEQASFDGIIYDCLQPHTSQVGWEPPNVPSLWEKSQQ